MSTDPGNSTALEAARPGHDPTAQARLDAARHRLTTEEVRTLVDQLKGIVSTLDNTDPEHRRAVYQQLNVTIVYHNDRRLRVTAGVACTDACVGGGT